MSVLDLIPQTEKETLKFRLLALMVLALAFLYRADEVPLFPTLAIVGGYLAYAYILRTFLIPRFTSYLLLAIMLLIDVETIIAALYIINLDSPIFGLLPVVVVYYSLYLGYFGGIAAATVSAMSYTGLVVSTGEAGEMENILALQPFFYILALLVGYIAQQRFRETQERRGLQQLISAESNAKTLLDLAQTLNRVMDPATVANDMARLGTLAARVAYCVIFVRDPDTGTLVHQGSNLPPDHLPSDGSDQFFQLQGSDSFVYSVPTIGGAPTGDGGEEPEYEAPQWLREIGGRKVLGRPLTGLGENVGLICFVATDADADIGEETLATADAFAEVAGKFIASTQLYAQAERRTRRVAAELQQSVEMAGRFRELTQRRNMRFGPLMIEPARESVRWQDTTLRLTKTEFDLLYVLAEKSGSVVNQDTLIREVWGQDYIPQGKVVDVTIHRLRRKLGTLPQGRNLVKTVRGQGYTFVAPERFVAAS